MSSSGGKIINWLNVFFKNLKRAGRGGEGGGREETLWLKVIYL